METYDLQLQTGKAWAYKEMLRDLWSQVDAASATGYFYCGGLDLHPQ